MRYLILTALIFSISLSCKDKSTIIEPDIDYGYDYFPLAIGKELIYQVDSIIYDPISETSTETDTNVVYIKEIVADTFTDETGRKTFRIERYEKPEPNASWELKDVWSALRTDRNAERFEENLRFVKMVFPVERGDVWNGNLYIDETSTFPVAGESIEIFKGWEYEVTSVAEQELIGDLLFDRVTTIVQVDEENLIEKRYSVEKYAEGVGLVYRKMEIMDTQKIDETIPWDIKAYKGFRLQITLIEHN